MRNDDMTDATHIDLRAAVRGEDGWGRAVEVSHSTSSSHPNLVLLDPTRGIIAIDIYDAVAEPARKEFVELNRRIEALRADIRADDDLPIVRVLAAKTGIAKPTLGVAERVLVPAAHLKQLRWLDLVPQRALDQDSVDEARAALFPSIAFSGQLRRGVSDDGAEDRARLRVVLDQEQAHVAAHHINDTLLLTGPPGSGKTLVLAARARLLAAEHPDWHIQMICFNKTLVPYLQRLVADSPNIGVSRMWEIARDFGIRFSFDDDDVTSAGLRAAQRNGLPRPFDAVLIDEVQDFRIPWLEIAHALMQPGRGGMLIAGDTAQALYYDADLPAFVKKTHAEHVALPRPYRSTRQILSAIQSLDPAFTVGGLDDAPDGEPVDLVWAESWDQQAQCVAWEVDRMLSDGLQPSDIGILVTKYGGTYGRIERALAEHTIPYSAMAKRDKGEFDLFSNTVKLLTVHSAKGYEFKAVVLFGLEALPDPDGIDLEKLRRARVAFVGATRAMDTLIITYTRDNKFLARLSSDAKYVRRYAWPDDYEGVADG